MTQFTLYAGRQKVPQAATQSRSRTDSLRMRPNRSAPYIEQRPNAMRQLFTRIRLRQKLDANIEPRRGYHDMHSTGGDYKGESCV